MVATRPISTERKFRFSGGKTMKEVAKTVGIIAPPRKPCSARKMIIELMSQASAHKADVSVKPAAAMAKKTRVDMRRERMPVSGIITTSAIRYEVCTQLISSELAARPAWISAMELETIWISRIAMNMPKTM